MKKILGVLGILICLPLLSALSLTVDTTPVQNVVIVGTEMPATFTVELRNTGPTEDISLYNLGGFLLDPSELTLTSGQTREVLLTATPIGEHEEEGVLVVPMFIRGEDDEEITTDLVFRIIRLGNAFDIGTSTLNKKDAEITLFIENKYDLTFEDVSVEFSSLFFDETATMTLGPKETKTITIPIEKDDVRKMEAGFYTLTADIIYTTAEDRTEGIIEFPEDQDVKEMTEKSGFLIKKETIFKENDGNTLVTVETQIRRSAISAPLTTFSPRPDRSEEQGFSTLFVWVEELEPGESMEIQATTNWFLPILVLIVLVVAAVIVRWYLKRDIAIRKKVTYVRTRGGEFAVKVSVFVNAKRDVERVSIIERYPAFLRVHPRFGREEPIRIDHHNQRVEWGFDRLQAGETRVLSYILFSKVGVMGKFALPPAMGVYERDGAVFEAQSNNTFFVTEEKEKSEPSKE